MRIAARIISIAVVIGYPFAVWRGLTMASGRIVGGVVLVALAVALPLRFISRPKRDFELLGSGITLLVLVFLAVLLDDHRFLLAMPVLINATLLAGFGMSLRAGRMPLVERFARMTHKNLSVEQIRHCRSVNRIWWLDSRHQFTCLTRLKIGSQPCKWRCPKGLTKIPSGSPGQN